MPEVWGSGRVNVWAIVTECDCGIFTPEVLFSSEKKAKSFLAKKKNKSWTEMGDAHIEKMVVE